MTIQGLDDQKHRICAELVEKVREIIAIDANFTVRMLAEELNSSYCIIYIILTDDLGKIKVCACFVPHQLSEDQKIARVESTNF